MIRISLIVLLQVFLLVKAEFPKENQVYLLDNTNFHDFFKKFDSSFIVLKYFKTGCPACSNFHPQFQDLAQSFAEAGETNVVFAEVNVMLQENGPLSHYLFKDPSKPAHFPTVKIYYKGLENDVQFDERERNKETLTTWIKQQIDSKTQEQKSEL